MILNGRCVARDVVVLGASAGGFDPCRTLLGSLAPGLAAGFVLVFHRSSVANGQLLPIFRRASGVPVLEPEDGQPFAHGVVFLAPRDRHLLLERGSFRLSRGPALHHLRPAADALFCSAAAAYGPRVLGVVLSGGGFDGARGCLAIKAAGGMVLTQSPEEATFPFMPRHAIQQDHVDAALPLAGIIAAIPDLVSARPLEDGELPR